MIQCLARGGPREPVLQEGLLGLLAGRMGGLLWGMGVRPWGPRGLLGCIAGWLGVLPLSLLGTRLKAVHLCGVLASLLGA